jgi:hypothetical protein
MRANHPALTNPLIRAHPRRIIKPIPRERKPPRQSRQQFIPGISVLVEPRISSHRTRSYPRMVPPPLRSTQTKTQTNNPQFSTPTIGSFDNQTFRAIVSSL